MSSCEQIQFLISQLIDRELDKEEAALVAEHLKNCEDCAAMYRAFSALSSCLSEDLEEPPEILRENVMAELRRGEVAKKNRRLSRPVRSLLAAAACMALIIGLAYGTAPLLRSPAAVDTAQAPAVAAPAGGAAGEREAVVLMAETAAVDAPAEAALDMNAVPEEESAEGSALDGAVPAPASVSAPVYSAADSAGTVTVEAPETAEDLKQAPAEAPAPLPEEAPASYSAFFSVPSAPDAGKAADYIECWDSEKQGELMDLLKGRVMAISARIAGQEELSDEELAESPAYIFSLEEGGQRQINVYIRDGKVYYADSEEGFMLPAHCSEEELTDFLSRMAA